MGTTKGREGCLQGGLLYFPRNFPPYLGLANTSHPPNATAEPSTALHFIFCQPARTDLLRQVTRKILKTALCDGWRCAPSKLREGSRSGWVVAWGRPDFPSREGPADYLWGLILSSNLLECKGIGEVCLDFPFLQPEMQALIPRSGWLSVLHRRLRLKPFNPKGPRADFSKSEGVCTNK